MLTVIAGPPCSGKTTRAASMGIPVVDWDVVYSEMSGLPMHLRRPDPSLTRRVEARFRWALEGARRRGPVVVIRAAPERRTRGLLRRLYGARVIVLEVPAAECIRRLATSGRPPSMHGATRAAIRSWWAHYQPSPRDVVERWS